MEKLAGLFAQFRSHGRLALLVEAAFLTPAFSLLALGAFEWGGYFWLQHRVQQAADQALVAALSTSDPSRRQNLALVAAEQRLRGRVTDLYLETAGGSPTLRLAYDASGSPIYVASRLFPLPPPIIVRLASRS